MSNDVVTTQPVAIRTKDGKFLPGKSGNPHGRPPTKRDKINAIQQRLELAIRRNLDPRTVSKIVQATAQDALDAEDSKTKTAARKLIFEYCIAKPSNAEDKQERTENKISIVIENATVQAIPVVDATFKEVTNG